MGDGGFQNIFCLIDEKRKLTSSKVPYKTAIFVLKPLKKFAYDSGIPSKSRL
jgi:hypothetical protein